MNGLGLVDLCLAAVRETINRMIARNCGHWPDSLLSCPMRKKLNSETVLGWLSRTVVLLWTCFAAGGFYFKDRAIREMHDPSCCMNPVRLTELSAQPEHVSRATALGYQITQ